MYNIDFNHIFGVEEHGESIAHAIVCFIIALVGSAMFTPICGLGAGIIAAIFKVALDNLVLDREIDLCDLSYGISGAAIAVFLFGLLS